MHQWVFLVVGAGKKHERFLMRKYEKEEIFWDAFAFMKFLMNFPISTTLPGNTKKSLYGFLSTFCPVSLKDFISHRVGLSMNFKRIIKSSKQPDQCYLKSTTLIKNK
jgi:hypothetical protein